MKTYYLRIILPTIITILLFISTIFLVVIPRYQENIMNGKQEMIKELTNSSWSILSKYHNDEAAGILTKEKAQELAISRIRYLRYGDEGKDYFWITDMQPKMVMHPFRNDLEGKDLNNFRDPHGKRMFVEFVETVRKSDQGYVDYMWQWKDDSAHIVPKLSYVKIFKPWNWVIGTGIYIEDAKKEIASLTRNLIWLSTGISILIALLLLYLLQQSLKIENKRVEARKELQESRERYRALVEASTEGILMIIDGKINYANPVITSLTGFDTNELIDRPIEDLISKSSNRDMVEVFSKSTIREGQFEANILKKDGGFFEGLIISSKSSLFDKNVNILVVKNLSTDKGQEFSNVEYQKLINTLNVGFFKAKLDNKGQFLYANETALRILGINSLTELSDLSILKLLTDKSDKHSLRRNLGSSGFIKDKVVRIQRKNGEYSVVSVTLIIVNPENNDEYPVCDGIIEDITAQEEDKRHSSQLITYLYSAGLKMEETVSAYLSPIEKIDADMPIKDVISLMNRKNTDVVLVTKNQSAFIGIITKSDIQHRILALNLDLENPAYLIMSSPIVIIPENSTVFNALQKFEKEKIHHLVTNNQSNDITGIVSIESINRTLLQSYAYLTAAVASLESFQALKESYLKLQKLIKSLIKSDISAYQITAITASFSDNITRRVIELVQQDIGPAPVEFAFISMGSEGRKEETLLTDQDNAIVFEDVEESMYKSTQDYFNTLGKQVSDALNIIGYSYCKGNIMAKNPQWCQSYSVWVNYFNAWMSTPEPHNLMEAAIFFDFRCVYGNEGLTDKLRNSIQSNVQHKPNFLYHLAQHSSMIKPVHLSGNFLTDKNPDTIDLKLAIAPIVTFARTYAFKFNIRSTNTSERLLALKEQQILSETMADDIIYVYNFLMKLRFRNQSEQSDSDLPLTNVLNNKHLIEIETYILKKALSSIPDYQSKIKLDFSIST